MQSKNEEEEEEKPTMFFFILERFRSLRFYMLIGINEIINQIICIFDLQERTYLFSAHIDIAFRLYLFDQDQFSNF